MHCSYYTTEIGPVGLFHHIIITRCRKRVDNFPSFRLPGQWIVVSVHRFAGFFIIIFWKPEREQSKNCKGMQEKEGFVQYHLTEP